MKTLFLAALLFASTASAQVQKWEYAALAVQGKLGLNVENTLIWASPESETSFYANKISEVSKFAFNYEDSVGTWFNFMTEAGKNGWELASIEQHDLSSLGRWGKTYWFKRPVSP